jgi:hypothetical protein
MYIYTVYFGLFLEFKSNFFVSNKIYCDSIGGRSAMPNIEENSSVIASNNSNPKIVSNINPLSDKTIHIKTDENNIIPSKVIKNKYNNFLNYFYSNSNTTAKDYNKYLITDREKLCKDIDKLS